MNNELIFCIKTALSNLNTEHGGDEKFEGLCKDLVSRCIDPNFIPSSGSDNGGDGGIDGWSVFGEGKSIKYAFSIQKTTKKKIKSEIKKSPHTKIRFFSNQQISQKIQEAIKKEFPDKKIEIFDQEAISHYILNNLDLGDFIGLKKISRKLDIAYVKNSRQIKTEEAKNYIPRTVRLNDEEKYVPVKDFLLKDTSFTIVQAPAGYGKTSFLKYIYNFILDNKTENLDFLPPVFISLADYNGNNFENLVKESQPGLFIKDCILLLDGYDEIDSKFQESFIKELKVFTKSNNSIKRNVIMTSRTMLYSKNDFIDFNPKIVLLNSLSDNDINDYVNLKILSDKKSKLLNNSLFLSLKGNVFYLVNIVEYFKTKGNSVDSIPNLMEYIAKNEICLIFRNKELNGEILNNFESLALYMILNQKMRISEDDERFGLKLQLPFSFSHKTIMEYLAAKKICRQNSLENINNLLFVNDRVPPFLLNVFGFILNILMNESSRKDLFEELLKHQLETKNAFSLLKVENDKLTPELNEQIIKALFAVHNSMADYRDNIQDIIDIFINGNVNENFALLVSALKNADDKDYGFFTYLLMFIVSDYPQKIEEKYQQEIYDFFIELLKNGSRLNFIESLFFSISKFSICEKNQKDYDWTCDRLISFAKENDDFSSLVECLAVYTKTCNLTISAEQYIKIYDLLIFLLKREDSKEADFIPNQIEKSKTTVFQHIIFFHSFISFSNEYFEKYTEEFLKILKLISEEKKVSLNSNSELKDLYSVFSKHIVNLLKSKSVEIDDLETIEKILIDSPSAFNNSFLWNEFSKSLPFSEGEKLIKDILLKTSGNFMHWHFLMDYCLNSIKAESDFDLFENDFCKTENQLLNEFYNDFYLQLDKNNPLYSYIDSKIDKELRNKKSENEIKRNRFSINFKEKHLLKAKQDYHIVFHKDELVSEIHNIFEKINLENEEKEILTWKSFLDFTRDDYENPNKEMINEFIRWWIWDILRHSNSVSEQKIISYINADNWKYNYVIQLLLFMKSSYLNYSDFTQDEVLSIKNWILKVLDNYPLYKADSALYKIHLYLSIVLRETNYFESDKNFKENYSNKLYGLIFSGFSNVLIGTWQFDYSYYSLDYLERYIDKDDIRNFILTKLNDVVLTEDKILAVYGYLYKYKNFLSGIQINQVREKITDFIRKNLNENKTISVIECAYDFDFKITAFSEKELCDCIELDEQHNVLKHNYAYFLVFDKRFTDKDESEFILKVIKKKFLKSSDITLKKILAEYYISLDKRAGKIFKFYINYLISPKAEPTVSTLFFTSVICTEDIKHLPLIEELFNFLTKSEYHWENDFQRYLNSIVVNSYRAIGKNVKTINELNKVLKSLKKCSKVFPYFESIAEDIKNNFSVRNYIPHSIEQIKNLA